MKVLVAEMAMGLRSTFSYTELAQDTAIGAFTGPFGSSRTVAKGVQIVARNADRASDARRAASPAGSRTTVLGENMKDRVVPYADATGGRTLPMAKGSGKEWDALSSQQKWKANDGALRSRIKEGDSFEYIGIDPDRLPAKRQQFDLTRSELLRLDDRGVPYLTVPSSTVQQTIGRP